MGNRRREPRRTLKDKLLGLVRRDALLEYYPTDLVEAYRRKDPGSVFPLLKSLESPPTELTHVRTTKLVAVPDEIGYQRSSGDLLTIKMRESMEHLDEMFLIAAKFSWGEAKPKDLPEVGYFYKWRVASASPLPPRQRILGGTFEGLSRDMFPAEAWRPSFHLRRELPHMRRTFRSKLGDAGVRLEGDPRIKALDPRDHIDDGDELSEPNRLPPSRDMP